jgi:crotonobetainyl-CoA:carnitine CoA-transferase CaiB-like acyl-CoA transferase
MKSATTPPLEGILVLDLSRMIPGAMLARQLIDLGARLIKVEEPGAGDPMRLVPPQVGDMSLGYAAMVRGAESVSLDLRQPEGAAAIRAIARRADVVVENFRPGTLKRWELGWEELRRDNPRLVWCSITSFGSEGEEARRVGHDLNFVAETGALRAMRSDGISTIQLADVGAALLATSSILGALLARERTGEGRRVEQPLATGPLPFVTWSWADAAAGGGSGMEALLGGLCPCYRTYPCVDGREISVGALEPKFWITLTELLGVPEAAAAGLDVGEEGARAAEAVAAAFASRPLEHWLELGLEHDLPLAPVNDAATAVSMAVDHGAAWIERTPLPEGGSLPTPGPFVAGGCTPDRPAPALGEHTEAVLREFGLL